MATWKLRTAAGERGPLTIYQLQQLVSSGAAGPDAEVQGDGPWRRVDQVPQLARLLPGPDAKAPGTRVFVNGVALEVGPDGKPLPPTAAQVAQMLAASGERVDVDRVRRARTVLLGVGVALFVLCALLLGAILTRG